MRVKDEHGDKGTRTLLCGEQREGKDANGPSSAPNLKLQQLDFPGFLFKVQDGSGHRYRNGDNQVCVGRHRSLQGYHMTLWPPSLSLHII